MQQGLYTAEAIEGKAGETAAAGYHHSIWHG